MAELIHTYSGRVRGRDGTSYEARACGEPQRGGTWIGWLEFRPGETGGDGASVIRTGRETTQPDRKALEYWAGGLEPIYLEGALGRASAGRDTRR